MPVVSHRQLVISSENENKRSYFQSLSYTYIGLQPKRPQVKMPELTSYGMENNGQYLFIKHMKTIVFISKFNTKVAEIRSKRSNVLLLDGGDRFVGTLSFTQYKGLADSFFINRYPYDAMVSAQV